MRHARFEGRKPDCSTERVATSARQPHNHTMSSVDDRVAEGAAALARGDWTAARGHFEASLDREETTAGLEGLSDALFWLEEIGPSIERRTRACMLYQEAGDVCRAARAALWLAMSYFSALGNSAAGNGWLQRANGCSKAPAPAPSAAGSCSCGAR